MMPAVLLAGALGGPLASHAGAADASALGRRSPAQQAAIDRSLRPSYQECLKHAHFTRAMEHCNLAEITWQQDVLAKDVQTLAAGLSSVAQRKAFAAQQANWSRNASQLCSAVAAHPGRRWAIEGQVCNLDQTVLRRLALEARSR